MPAQSTIEVSPPQTLSAADSAARHLTQAATPAAGATPTGGGGTSLADAAAAALALKVSTHTAQMSAALAGDGPEEQAVTQADLTRLEQTDEANAQALRQLGQQAQASTRFV
jgi:hypothetical protein